MSEEPEMKMPKRNTRTEILTHLLGEDLTALDLKEKVDINENAVRKHLRRLETFGFVQHYFEKASRGRPKKYFTLTERGKELFPRKHLFLLNELLRQIDEVHGKREIERLFENISKRFRKSLDLNDNLDFEERIEELTKRLNELDFFCEHSKKEGLHELEYKNCIFSGITEEYTESICKMHEEVIRSSFEEKIYLERDGSILNGNETCKHLIKR